MRLEINYKGEKKKPAIYKTPNTWHPEHAAKEPAGHSPKQSNGKLRKYPKTSENENTTIQNIWGAAKAVLRGKSRAIQAYLQKQEKSQTNHLTLHLKEAEKEKQTKPKVSRRKEIMKNRAEINETETKNREAQLQQDLVL